MFKNLSEFQTALNDVRWLADTSYRAEVKAKIEASPNVFYTGLGTNDQRRYQQGLALDAPAVVAEEGSL